MIRLINIWVHWHSALLAQQVQMMSHHTRQKNYRMHTIACIHNIVHVNCYTCIYLFPKKTEHWTPFTAEACFLCLGVSACHISLDPPWASGIFTMPIVQWNNVDGRKHATNIVTKRNDSLKLSEKLVLNTSYILMPSYIAQAHMQVSLHVQFIAYAKPYFHFLFCYYYILHIKRMFPNKVYTDGKTFCLNH